MQHSLATVRFNLLNKPHSSSALVRSWGSGPVRAHGRHSCSCRVVRPQSPRSASKGPRLRVQATADSAALQPPSRGDGSSTSSSRSSFQSVERSSGSGDAVYIKSPVAGGVLEYPGRSVVVLGDVPAGSVLRAGGDIIVLGRLSGEAAAGVDGDTSAVLLVNKLEAEATLSIAGCPAEAAAPARSDQLMLCLQPGATAAIYTAMPGTAPLLPPVPAPSLALKLGRTAAALSVLLLGLALVLAPGAVLGNLLSTTAESVAGALLDVFIFGYILLQGAGLLAEGSELLLEIVNPGIIGGVVLPVLGALPDSLIILTSLSSASQAEAQEAVAVGIGTLAGSTILLLSLAWGCSVILGRCDINARGLAQDKTLTRGWDLFNTGVTVDRDVGQGAAIMAASVLLYGIVQVPAFFGASDSPQAALAGAVICLSACVGYCIYSVLFPGLQKRRIDAARRKRFRMVAVKAMALRSTEMYGSSLVDPLGRLNVSTARTIFDEFDKDNSGAIDSMEVQGLLMGLQLAGPSGSGSGSTSAGEVDKDTLEYWFKEFDVDADRRITFEEFRAGLGRWVDEKMTAAQGGRGAGGGWYSSMLDPRQGGAAATVLADLPFDDLAALQETAAELEGEAADEAAEEMEGEGGPLSTRDILVRAVAKMGAGIALCAVFSDPLVEALTNLSRATGIPAFVVGFVLTPLASNSSEFVSSLTFAARKRRKNMSLTLSQVYGAVTMNNTLVLGLFLLVVWIQRLEWVYSSEVTVIVSATLAIGALAVSRNTFRTWLALPALLLYPASLAGVHALDTFLGWQ